MPAAPSPAPRNVVHGGFVDGSGWEAVYRSLRKDGHTVSIVQNPTISLADDVRATKRIIAAQKGPVILMDASGVDAWACPAATGPAPEGLESTGDPSMQLPWTPGLPVVTLPWGTAANGLPLGLQLVGRFMDDERLLAWASPLEGSTPST